MGRTAAAWWHTTTAPSCWSTFGDSRYVFFLVPMDGYQIGLLVCLSLDFLLWVVFLVCGCEMPRIVLWILVINQNLVIIGLILPRGRWSRVWNILYLKKTQLQNLQKLDITDATLSTAALSNLKHILSCMPMLKSVETNSLDVYSILPSRISRVMNSLTGVESSNVRDRENTDGRQTTSGISLWRIYLR